ncbi:hypothetical protein ABKN59_008225 [Abortiporus biennis]
MAMRDHASSMLRRKPVPNNLCYIGTRRRNILSQFPPIGIRRYIIVPYTVQVLFSSDKHGHEIKLEIVPHSNSAANGCESFNNLRFC